MSFSKAKVVRFNDVNEITPSPADYNPDDGKTRLPGGVMSNSERFNEEKLENVSILSNSSTSGLRTPTPKKKSKEPKKTPSKGNSSEMFREKEVEIENKTAFIRDLKEQIANLSDQIETVMKQRESLEEEQEYFQKQLDDLQLSHKCALQIANDTYADKKNALQRDFNNFKLDLADLTEAQIAMKKEYCVKMLFVAQATFKTNEAFQISTDDYLERIGEIRMLSLNKEKQLGNFGLKLTVLEVAHKQMIERIETQHQENIGIIRKLMEDKLKKFETKYLMNSPQAEFKKNGKMTFEPIENVEEIESKTENKSNSDRVDSMVKNLFLCIHNGETYFNDELINKVKEAYSKHIKEYKKQDEIEIEHIRRVDNGVIYELKNNLKLELDKYDNEQRVIMQRAQEGALATIESTTNDFLSDFEVKRKEYRKVFDECKKVAEITINESKMERNAILEEIGQLRERVKFTKEKLDLNNTDKEIKNCEKILKGYDKTVESFKRFEKSLVEDIESLEKQKLKFTDDVPKYYAAICRTHETITTLENRLLESDGDVIILKDDLGTSEWIKSEWEKQCDRLIQNMYNLTKKKEDLNLQKESSVTIFKSRIERLKNELLTEIENSEKHLVKELEVQNAGLNTKEANLNLLTQHFHEMEMLNSEALNMIHLANVEIEDLEKKNSSMEKAMPNYNARLAELEKTLSALMMAHQEVQTKLTLEKEKNEKLQKQLKKSQIVKDQTEVVMKQLIQLEEKYSAYNEYCEYYKNKSNQLESEISKLNQINKDYIEQSKNYENLLQKYETNETKVKELQQQVAQYKALVIPYHQQLVSYQSELSNLLNQKDGTTNYFKSLGLRYAETLGHQNQKQEIKYAISQQQKHIRLKEENEVLESKIRVQTTILEKLKAEQATKNVIIPTNKPVEIAKENATSSPLRDRN